MLLAIDVGNTHLVIGVYREERLMAQWRVASAPEKTADEFAVLLSRLFQLQGISIPDITHVILSSVVPPLTHNIKDYISAYLNLEPMVVGEGIDTGMPICCEEPKEVGADRIVNAVAGIKKFGVPLIIVDFGTATTFDAISEAGEYLGGAIAPGIRLSMEALFTKAARLPKIDVKKPASVIGRNTVECMQSGIFYGYAGLVDGILERMMEEMGGEVQAVATGGLAELIVSASRYIFVSDPLLTLEGLRIIYERNRRSETSQ